MIRPARVDEAHLLSDLALRCKAYWGLLAGAHRTVSRGALVQRRATSADVGHHGVRTEHVQKARVGLLYRAMPLRPRLERFVWIAIGQGSGISCSRRVCAVYPFSYRTSNANCARRDVESAHSANPSKIYAAPPLMEDGTTPRGSRLHGHARPYRLRRFGPGKSASFL
jgi:hypothetical protein